MIARSVKNIKYIGSDPGVRIRASMVRIIGRVRGLDDEPKNPLTIRYMRVIVPVIPVVARIVRSSELPL